MIVECPKCGLRFDDNNYEWNCPQHMGLGGICSGCDLFNCLCPEDTKNPRSKKYKIEERVDQIMAMNETTEDSFTELVGEEFSKVLRQAIVREDTNSTARKLKATVTFTSIEDNRAEQALLMEEINLINTETHHLDGTPRQYNEDGSEIALEDILQVEKEIAQGANSADE